MTFVISLFYIFRTRENGQKWSDNKNGEKYFCKFEKIKRQIRIWKKLQIRSLKK